MRNFSMMLLAAVLWSASNTVVAEDLLTPEHLIQRYEFSDPNWSSSGGQLALVVKEPVNEDGHSSNIWLYETQSDQFRQITWGSRTHARPRFSPDGKTLAFIAADEDDNPGLSLLPMTGGEARPMSTLSGEIIAFEWSPDGTQIAFVVSDNEPEDEEMAAKHDEIVASEAVVARHLKLIDVADGTVTPLLEHDWRVTSFGWHPDGISLAVSASDNESITLLTDRLLTVSRDGSDVIEVARPDSPLDQLTVSPDGQYLTYIGSTDGGPIPHSIYLQPIEGGDAIAISGSSLDRLVSSYRWADDGNLVVLAADGFGDQFVQLSMQGDNAAIKRFPERSVTSFDTQASKVAFIAESAVTAQELWVRDESGERQISALNSPFPTLLMPTQTHYVGDNGLSIEAALFTPSVANPDKNAWPTVLLIHGGPAGRWSNRINEWAQLLVSRGYAVLAPNIRGSVGYGMDFIRLNRHDWGGADYRDAIAGMDDLIKRQYTDPDRTAIAGWSYGGYLSAWSITQTDRFKAAIIGAPMTDLAVEYGTELAEINAYDTWYLGTPYENLDEFVRMSPMTHIKSARTPALILIGAEDDIDPVGQSQQFYRGLKRYGVDADLVIYPREPHGIREYNHRIDVLNRMAAWISIYLE